MPLFLVTVTAALMHPADHDSPPGDVVDALMKCRDVVTVRAEGGGRPVVYRVDVAAPSEGLARERAVTPALRAAARLGLRADIRSVAAVPEVGRMEEFRRTVGARRELPDS